MTDDDVTSRPEVRWWHGHAPPPPALGWWDRVLVVALVLAGGAAIHWALMTLLAWMLTW